MTVYILWQDIALMSDPADRSIVDIYATREAAEAAVKHTACKCGHSLAHHSNASGHCHDCECRSFFSTAYLEIEEREVKS